MDIAMVYHNKVASNILEKTIMEWGMNPQNIEYTSDILIKDQLVNFILV